MDQPGKVANPARGQLNRENEYFPVPHVVDIVMILYDIFHVTTWCILYVVWHVLFLFEVAKRTVG